MSSLIKSMPDTTSTPKELELHLHASSSAPPPASSPSASPPHSHPNQQPLNAISDLQQHTLHMGHDSVEIDYEALPENSPILAQLSAGAFAGIMEHTVMYPVDAIKTRLQVSKVHVNEGLIQSFSKISSSEGLIALWRGVSSVILGAGPAHAVYFMVFESTKTYLVDHFINNSTSSSLITDEKHPLIASLSGIAATTTSDALMNPFDVIKQRMQIYKSNNRTAISPSVFKFINTMYQKEGFRSFYLSYPTTLMLNIPFAAINFGVYEYSSTQLNPTQAYNPLLHCVAGAISGAAAAAVTTPFDCVKTVLQTKSYPNVTGFMSASKQLYLHNGYSGFLRGLKPRVVFNVPSTAISWTAYEMAKAYLLKSDSNVPSTKLN